jgi:SHS2 domain-containing protein
MEAGPSQSRALVLEAPYLEGLLVAFLEELRFLGEVEGLAFDSFDLQVKGFKLEAHLEGRPVASRSKEIKAVTYHNLAVQQTDQGLRANIVFDV